MRLEFFERLERVGVDRRDSADKRGGNDDEAKRALDNSDSFEKGGEKEAGDDDGEEKKDGGRGKNAAHESLELAILFADRKTRQLVAEGVGEGGNWDREEVGELGERLHCAELGRIDILRHEPQADKSVEQVGCAAGAEEHQRVPPEIAEPGVEFGENLHGYLENGLMTLTPAKFMSETLRVTMTRL